VVKICRIVRIKLNQFVLKMHVLYRCLTKKATPAPLISTQPCITNISESLPHITAGNSWHRYGMKKLRHRQPMYIGLQVYNPIFKYSNGIVHEMHVRMEYRFFAFTFFSASTLLFGRQEGHPACKSEW